MTKRRPFVLWLALTAAIAALVGCRTARQTPPDPVFEPLIVRGQAPVKTKLVTWTQPAMEAASLSDSAAQAIVERKHGKPIGTMVPIVRPLAVTWSNREPTASWYQTAFEIWRSTNLSTWNIAGTTNGTSWPVAPVLQEEFFKVRAYNYASGVTQFSQWATR